MLAVDVVRAGLGIVAVEAVHAAHCSAIGCGDNKGVTL